MFLLVVAVGVVSMLLLALFLVGIIPGLSTGSSGTKSGVRYEVNFFQSGLPTGTTWSVTLGGTTQTSQGAVDAFEESNGTYSFSLGTVQGYSGSPASGNVTVSGSRQTIDLTFTATSSTPLGTVFAWGIPINATGVSTTGCASTVGHYCYTIEIVGAGDGVSTYNVQLSLRNSVGGTVAWPAVTISLVSPSTAAVVATYSTGNSTWSLVPPFTGALAAGYTVVIYTSTLGSGAGLLGDQLVAIGADGFTGTVPSSTFT
jgi:hypothetical protein